MTYLQDFSSVVMGLQHRPAFSGSFSHRFLTKNMFAGFQRIDRYGSMKVKWYCYKNRVNFSAIKQVMIIFERFGSSSRKLQGIFKMWFVIIAKRHNFNSRHFPEEIHKVHSP